MIEHATRTAVFNLSRDANFQKFSVLAVLADSSEQEFMSSWDFLPKSGIYGTGSQRLCLFCFYVYKINFCTEIQSNISITDTCSSRPLYRGFQVISQEVNFAKLACFGQFCDLVPAKIIVKLLIQEIRGILDDSLNREASEKEQKNREVCQIRTFES